MAGEASKKSTRVTKTPVAERPGAKPVRRPPCPAGVGSDNLLLIAWMR